MSICLTGFAELIKIAAKRCKEARDPQAAEHAMREHLRHARRHVEEQIAAEAAAGVMAEAPRKGRVGKLD